MIVEPSLDILLEKVDSPYSLVIAAARRSRMLNEGEKPMLESKGNKTVSVALDEIAHDHIVINARPIKGVK